MKEDHIIFYLAGENLAYGQLSSIFAHEGLMNSLGHHLMKFSTLPPIYGKIIFLGRGIKKRVGIFLSRLSFLLFFKSARHHLLIYQKTGSVSLPEYYILF
ncbi:SCP-like extracellular [Neobacillus bataviensis LMG 21833]|uniref:SCP-like extracellular n=1 Tax=Neobacillus bataviensis LMG 21833 TaxID=1117379 RepID=K6D573_9BACI|nr:SCP-like extracellular [Neobacillus bataviensis LMG 21833]